MWRFIGGYVIIQIEGLSLERFLNAMLSAGTPVWALERTGRTCVRLRIKRKDFFRLIPIRRRYRCRVHVLEKRGLPFLWGALWRRKVLLFGSVALAAGFAFLSTRVLFVRVTGCERMEEDLLMSALAEKGVTPFMPWRGVDYVRIANDTAALFDEIAWLGLHRDGVFLTVEVRESIPLPEIEDYSVPCDVVATKAGVVVDITVLRGKAAVRPGDRVVDGQVLISGTVQYKDTPPYLTRARGTVSAAIVYDVRVEAKKTVPVILETGRTHRYVCICIGSRVIYQTPSPYPLAYVEAGAPVVVSQLLTPVTVESGVWVEQKESERTLLADEQKETALVEAEKTALLLLPDGADIIVKAAYTETENGVLYGRCRITTVETIGIQREITDGATE